MLGGKRSGSHLTVTAFVVLLVSACMHFLFAFIWNERK